MTLFPILLEAAGAGVEEKATSSLTSLLYTLLPFLLIVGVMYFFTIRPQKKREKKLKEQLEVMKPGDQVMSIGGIIGRVANITDDEVTIYSGVANTMLTFKKSAINTIIPKESEEAK